MRSLAIVVVALGCTDRLPRPSAPGPAAFAVQSPDVAVLSVGESLMLAHQFFDGSGTAITHRSPVYRSSNPLVADVESNGRVVARGAGEAQIIGTLDTATVLTQLRAVSTHGAEPVVDVFAATTHQVIRGWEAAGQFGEIECNPVAFVNYHRELVDRTVNELGITRTRLAVNSGLEAPDNHYRALREGRLNYPAWRATWMVAKNDNDDPFVANPSGYQWEQFDAHIDTVIVPLQRALAARGERLYINLNFVDFWLGAGTKAFMTMKDPEEYAELIRVVFDHLSAKYGWVPDGIELNLEPENTPYSGTEMGRALVAMHRRLRAGGFAPAISGPSTTKAANALAYYDAMMAVPGARGLITELSYHKYTGTSRATLRAILVAARRDGIETAMLEHIGSGFDGLYDDLTLANVSAWEQYAVSYCGRRDNARNPGVYYQINETDPAHPRINMTNEAKLMRQVFMYARPGAVRVGATSNSTIVRPLAFRNANGRMVVVARSTGVPMLTVRGLDGGTYGVNYSTRLGKYNIDLPDVAVREGQPLRLAMPVDGAWTIYGK